MPPLKAEGEFNIYIQLWGQSCANAAGTNLWHTALVPRGAAGPRHLPHAGALMVLPQKQLLELLKLLCGRERGKRGKEEWGQPRDPCWPHLDGSREWMDTESGWTHLQPGVTQLLNPSQPLSHCSSLVLTLYLARPLQNRQKEKLERREGWPEMGRGS